MPYGLAEAIGHNYKIPQPDMAGSLVRGFQLGEQVEQRKLRQKLLAQQAQEKRDDKFNASLQNMRVVGVHPALQSQAEEEHAQAFKDASDAYEKYGKRSNKDTARILNEAYNRQLNHKERSRLLYAFDQVPANERTRSWEMLNRALYDQGKGDARNVEGVTDPLTGDGFRNGIPVYKRYKPVDHNKGFGEQMVRYKMEYEGAQAIGDGDRLIQLGPPEQAGRVVAEAMFNEPNTYFTYFDENREYVQNKYGKNKELLAQGPLRENPVVVADLKQKFLLEKLGKGALMGKVMKDGKPGMGAGAGSTSGAVVFNEDVTDLNQAEKILQAAGVVRPNKKGVMPDYAFEEGQGAFLSLSPTSVTTGNIVDENGKTILIDNMKLVYVPSKNEWYAAGSSNKSGKPNDKVVKVTPTTIGPIASLYKMPAPALVDLMNNRMKNGGVNKSVNYGSSASGYVKKSNSNVKMGSEGQGPKVQTKGATPAKGGSKKIVTKSGKVFTPRP